MTVIEKLKFSIHKTKFNINFFIELSLNISELHFLHFPQWRFFREQIFTINMLTHVVSVFPELVSDYLPASKETTP